MLSAMHVSRVRVYSWWAVVICSAVVLKYYYSMATANELQWLLAPLAFLTQTLTGLQFDINGAGEWINDHNAVAIVKQCAGVNFMILVLPVYAKRYQQVVVSACRPGRVLAMTMCCLILCLVMAWAATLLVNSVRIILAIQLYRYEVTMAGLGPEQIHRIAGVLIYFPALWLQFRLFSGMKHEFMGSVAAALYIGMVIIVPLLTGNYRLNPQLFVENTLYTGGVTVLIYVLSRTCFKIRKFSFRRGTSLSKSAVYMTHK